MDTITHIVLGACVGEVMAGKKIGRKAMLIGAVAQSIPDIDIVAGFWLTPASDLLAHRGFTHSILFALLVAPVLAFFSAKGFKKSSFPFKKWVLFWCIQILIHLFIDSFNAYGTGLFEPFSHYRVSFNTIFVADPFFAISLGIVFLMLLFARKDNSKRVKWATTAITISACYLCLCIANKLIVIRHVKTAMQTENISHTRYFTTPTPLNSFLWFVVAEDKSGFNIAHSSVFDKQAKIDFRYYSRNDSLLKVCSHNDDLQHLVRFSKGYYTVEKWHDTLVFNDLRFGQMAGWTDTNAHFVFHFFLQQPGNNAMVIQRGRFANWDKGTVVSLLDRIRGN